MMPRRRKRRARRRNEAGFTLIELLVALALFSLLSLALAGSVHIGTNAWAGVTLHAEHNDRSLHARDLLRHLIEDTYPLFLSDDPANRHVDFDGTGNSIDFLTSAPMALRSAGRSRVMLSVEHRQGGTDLMIASTPELGFSGHSAANARKPLLERAAAIEFSYFGKLRSEREAAWHDGWSKQGELPRLVRVHVQFPASDRREWPDFVVAPRIMADVGCIVDPLTTHCRGR